MPDEAPPNNWNAQTGYITIPHPMQAMHGPPIAGFWVPANPNAAPSAPYVAPQMISTHFNMHILPYAASPPIMFNVAVPYAHPPTYQPASPVYHPPILKTKKEDKKTKGIASSAPGSKKPAMKPGFQYLYPAQHVTMHVTKKKLWHASSIPPQFQFEIYLVPCNSTVKELIERLGGGKGCAVTECMDMGGGGWSQGTTVKYNDEDKAKTPIGKLGWTDKRGSEQEPLWVVLWECK